ncbi:HalD/BesD family halogenase [Marinomonas transparens]|uniref:Fe2OG dioxygenase domain-containing protein n=1 Tax=Marinomonas transparens TaxID=2795388 RepID=A0A934JJ47_9GAMM|nr:hypothetical protein [Marinomonas transparens]MBJ7536731.1 hypothetical protein [Marinomonas transparens]
MSSYNNIYDKFSQRLSGTISDFSELQLANLKEKFKTCGLVNVRNILSKDMWKQLVSETNNIVKEHGIKRNISLEHSDNTRRALTTVGNELCRNNGPCMSAIYDNEAFLNFISEIAGERVSIFPNPVEQLAVSLMTEPGDTHGWHWDDCSFALIWMIECPPPSFGGFTQLVPNTGHEKGKTNIFEVLTQHSIESHYFPQESFYFFRSGNFLHQVHPLVKPTRRLIINMDFVSDSDLKRKLDTSTTELFY